MTRVPLEILFAGKRCEVHTNAQVGSGRDDLAGETLTLVLERADHHTLLLTIVVVTRVLLYNIKHSRLVVKYGTGIIQTGAFIFKNKYKALIPKIL